MTVNQIAKSWGCSASTVRSYCKSGLIPQAEKTGKFNSWDIPNIPKPPATVHRFVLYLRLIETVQEGADPDFTVYGNTEQEVRVIYNYLADYGFIQRINKKCGLKKALKNIQILSKGKELIRYEETKQPSKRKRTTSLTAKAELPGLSGEISSETEEEYDLQTT